MSMVGRANVSRAKSLALNTKNRTITRAPFHWIKSLASLCPIIIHFRGFPTRYRSTVLHESDNSRDGFSESATDARKCCPAALQHETRGKGEKAEGLI